MREKYRRERHRIVARVLNALNAAFLKQAQCYFGGGTRIALELDEYRESQDIDFLCSNMAGYRELRSGISQRSLGSILGKKDAGVSLLRDVRADHYGIRTVLAVDGEPMKFEIILEARIEVTGARIGRFPVHEMDRRSCFAEKWLANADRWGDESVLSRDAIDLSFMLREWDIEDARAGAEIAAQAYGVTIGDSARAAAAKLIEDSAYRKQCVRSLALDDTKGLLSGLKTLRKLATSLCNPE